LKTKTPLVPLLMFGFALMAAAGCSSSPINRIDANRARYESWPLEVQEAVLAGEARKGMTPEQVEVAMGKPTEVTSRGTDEIWVYRKSSGLGSGLLKNTSVGVGTSIGGVGLGTSTGLGGGSNRHNVTDEEEVVFVNGVVTRSGSGR
jgi:hypothetical protein